MTWKHECGGFVFEWDLQRDEATVKATDGRLVWNGGLLPTLRIAGENGAPTIVRSQAVALEKEGAESRISLHFPGLGEGFLRIASTPAGISFPELRLKWNAAPAHLVSLFFGAATEEIPGWKRGEDGFWPTWRADGFCVPSAKGAPVQSFFRFWDLGQADLALGSFGPTGTPYAAAFPRPLYCGAMGGAAGWVVAGPGAIPDGALYLKIRSGAACLHLLYREDLWGAPQGAERIWEEPLRLSWAAEAWEAYRVHFSTFPVEPVAPLHQRSGWNSWAEYRMGIYENRPLIDAVARAVRPEMFTFDDGWETCNSTGRIRRERFPDFEGDLAAVREAGMAVGLWQSVAWVDQPEEVGLGAGDLLSGLDGAPVRTNWLGSPYQPSHLALDPSSASAREFIRRKTHTLVGTLGAKLLKMDFGYGVPGPDVAAPRDPAYRGERLAFALYRLMADAARELNPDITLQCWGLSPLLRPAFNLLTMDDLGDAGAQEGLGHRQWSVWAALAGAQGTAIMASGGYDWSQDAEIVLNTAVIGAPGSVLNLNPKAGAVPPEALARRRAVGLWYRRTVQWRPLWLNTEKGKLGAEPLARCWGRLEPSASGESLRALALRDGADKPSDLERAPLRGIDWSGRWALLAQGDGDIYSGEVACIPLDEGWLLLPSETAPRAVVAISGFDQESPAAWQWKDGFIRIDATHPPLDLTGYLIRR